MSAFLISCPSPKPNRVCQDGRTPLHYAAAVGNEATTRVLLEAGAKLTADKASPGSADVATYTMTWIHRDKSSQERHACVGLGRCPFEPPPPIPTSLRLLSMQHGLTPVHTAAGASNGNPLTSVVAAATEALSALEKLHQVKTCKHIYGRCVAVSATALHEANRDTLVQQHLSLWCVLTPPTPVRPCLPALKLRGCRQEQAVAVLRCLTLLHHTRPRLAVAAGAPSAAEGAGSVQTRSSGLRAYDSDSASGCGEDSSDDDSDGARGMAWLPRFHRKCWAVYRRRRVVRVTARKSMRYPPQLYSER